MAVRTLPVIDPRTGRTEFHLPVENAEAVRGKADRLRAAQPRWAALGLEGRISALHVWSQAIGRHAAAITEADSRDTGFGQVSRIAPQMVQGFIRGGCAGAPGQLAGMHRSGTSPAWPNVRYETVLKPIPLVGVISPWNAPTMLSMMHVVQPLLAGCAVLVKPSEITPRFVAPIRNSLEGVPELAEIFDFAMGDAETGAAVVDCVEAISFTGSVHNGRKVAEACARRFIPCELELGGKDPLIITETANLEDAVSAAVRGAMTSAGQVCFAIERIYVHRSVHDSFVEMLVDRCARLRLNNVDPLGGEIGPFIWAKQADIVDAHLADALAKGATLRLGGPSVMLDGGRYMHPTVLSDVTHDMVIMREETFGPVAPVMAWDSEDEVVNLANDTEFGLSAAVMAGTEEEAWRIAERINAGRLSVQDAFLTFAAAPAEGDTFGQSGVGGKRSGIQRYLRRQAMLVNSARPKCLTEEALSSAGK